MHAAALQKSNSTPMDLLNATEDSSPCNSVPMNLLSARDRLRLEREERQARLDRRCIHGEKFSVAFSRFIGIELVT